MNIVLTEPLGISKETLNTLKEPFENEGHMISTFDTVAENDDELFERVKDADVIMLANHPISGNVIRNCKKLKYISVAFVGIDHVDVAACKEKNIRISNAAGYCTDAVAELTLGLTLDCLRNISITNELIRNGGTKTGYIGNELCGKTVGIIGTGAIGCRVAEIFKAFNCKLLGYSRTTRTEAEDIGIKYVELETLLRESDIITIHTPLTDLTRNLIDEEKVALMKSNAIFINTARGALVDSNALAAALKEGRIGAVGSDVFETEPPLESSHPLINAPRTVLTPHAAFATSESMDRRAYITFDNVAKWMQGTLQNVML